MKRVMLFGHLTYSCGKGFLVLFVISLIAAQQFTCEYVCPIRRLYFPRVSLLCLLLRVLMHVQRVGGERERAANRHANRHFRTEFWCQIQIVRTNVPVRRALTDRSTDKFLVRGKVKYIRRDIFEGWKRKERSGREFRVSFLFVSLTIGESFAPIVLRPFWRYARDDGWI